MRLLTYGKMAVLAFSLLVFQLPALAQTQSQDFLIGLIPEMNVFKQMERFRPLGEHLSKETGLDIHFTILNHYGNLIDAFEGEGMDGAFFGSFTGALAIEQLGVEPLARPVNPDGETTHHGVLYTRKDSGIKNVADMRGKKLAFVDKATTAGYIFPLVYLREKGVENLDNFFGAYFFAGSHDATTYAVLDGSADIGVSKNTVFDLVRSVNPRIDAEINVLALSETVPSDSLCVRSDLDDDIKIRLKQALLTLHETAEGRRVLEQFHAMRFVETQVADYQPVLGFVERAGIDLKRYSYLNK